MDEFSSYRSVSSAIESMLDDAESRLEAILADAFDQGSLLPEAPLTFGIALHEGPEGGLVVQQFGSMERNLADAFAGARVPVMRCDMDNRQLRMRVELPGLREEDVDIAIFDHQLSIRGQRNDIRFATVVDANARLDQDGFTAVLQDGVLQLTCPILARRRKHAPHQV